MFNLTSRRGVTCILSAVVLALTLVACNHLPKVDADGFYTLNGQYTDDNGTGLPDGQAMRADDGTIVDAPCDPAADAGPTACDGVNADDEDDEDDLDGEDGVCEEDDPLCSEDAACDEGDSLCSEDAACDEGTSLCSEDDADWEVQEFRFGPCHDAQTAKAASDGWIWILFVKPVLDAAALLEADVTTEDGSQAIYTFEVLTPDQATVVFPLDFFGQDVTVNQLLRNGEPLPIDGFETNFEVDSASDCTYHPSFYSVP